ncbi:hypothetical protein JKF63_02649 [Porcisia hertigi]|uniref:Uncharacterized protein n=1 Tax=Porcisia hertigi TaxID=2761500 RepID=A0A836H9W8_9TRYP|nr:hypothetical protein JKF63_02649 [Porcisia hertigi]
MALVSDTASQRAVPCDAQELRDRTHAYVSSVSSALDSIEDLLASWGRFRDGSSAAGNEQRVSTFRSVDLDSFTVLKPPPTITEAEIDCAVRRLTPKELQALHAEYELTCIDDFVYLNSDGDGESSATTGDEVAPPPAPASHVGATKIDAVDSPQPVVTVSALNNNASESPTGCTVEVGYAIDDGMTSSQHWALLEAEKNPVTKAAAATCEDTLPSITLESRLSWADEKVAAASTTGSDDDEDEVRSFTTFSRMALANESFLRRSRHAEGVGSMFLKTLGRVQAEPNGWTATAGAHRDADPTQVKKMSEAAAASAPSRDFSPPHAAAAENLDPTSGRSSFVRTRVRDVLLANQVRAKDKSVLCDAFVAKMDAALSAAAGQTTPVLERLHELLCESRALLRVLDVMDHQAYRERVKDPSQYLCIPRYSVACQALDCHTPFSATVTRVTCGRCGQFFCPSCCAERGLGPDVKCGGQRYSLGWEPICRLCFQMCYDSQRRVSEERKHVLMIESRPSGGRDAGGDANTRENSNHTTAAELNLKQAVLFGAYCDESHCLSDGLPPFYVIHCNDSETVDFWDILGYHFAKARGSLRRSWQNAGNLAAQAVNGAAQMMSRRRGALR